jgi:predicted AlkP superfamily phosphohydrolase/phosphomutase
MVADFLTPDTKTTQYTYPAELADEIEEVVGDYMVDVPNFRTDEKERLLRDIEDMTAKRFRLAEHLLETRPWDLFFLVEIGTDRMHHRFWHDELALRRYYRSLDERIGRLLRFVDDETTVLVVSDHGAQTLEGGVYVNEWLRAAGHLVLRDEPVRPRRLTPEIVDWGRTTAWAEGGYYARVFLNVRGREPDGTVAPPDYEAVRDDLARGLEALVPRTVAHRPDVLYAEVRGVAPDLLVYFGGLALRSLGDVGTGRVLVGRDANGLDRANHSRDGIYIAAGPGIEPGPGPERSLLDVAPTILDLLGEAVPDEMEGASFASTAHAGPRATPATGARS